VGWKTVLNYEITKNQPDWYSQHGSYCRDRVSTEFNINERRSGCLLHLHSHQKACKGCIQRRQIQIDQIVPVSRLKETYIDENGKRKSKEFVIDTDEGPRADTTLGSAYGKTQAGI
jgi:acetyl-CoA acyltransferase